MSARILGSILLVAACNGPEPVDSPPADPVVAVLGGGTHSVDDLDVTTIARAADGLAGPTDLAFHPTADELWIVNQVDESITIVAGPAGEETSASTAREPVSGHHFLARPSGIAFSDNGDFATIHDTDDKTQGENGTPEDFMGPTLWTGDSSVFDGGHDSHLDMLHNSPNGKGIAWESGNTFWIVDGYHASVTRYRFKSDHGLGGADHSDGVVSRFVEGELTLVPTLPAHAELDHSTDLLYVADSGTGRVLALDTASGSEGAPLTPNYDGTEQYSVDNASMIPVIEGLQAPVGVALYDDLLFVSDAGAGTIHAFDLEGREVDWLEVGGTPCGIAFASDGSLYVVDPGAEQVVRYAVP